jgi:hypothetical protein
MQTPAAAAVEHSGPSAVHRTVRRSWTKVAIAASIAIVGGAALLATRSVWIESLTIGRNLVATRDEQPTFGPRYWRRDCAGWVFGTWERDRLRLVCVGWPRGPRREYLLPNDPRPWAPSGIPTTLVPRLKAALSEPIRSFQGPLELEAAEPTVLAWRRSGWTDEVLLALRGKNGTWKLGRVCVPEPTSDSQTNSGYDFSPWVLSLREHASRPTNSDLAAFVEQSGWSETVLHPPITTWGVDGEAWRFVSGGTEPEELRRELARLGTYVAPDSEMTLRYGTDTKPAVKFHLKPGQQALLAESTAHEVARQCSRGGVPEFEATWTPTPDDILKMEERLPALHGALFRFAPRTMLCPVLRGLNLNDYHLQYFGMIEKGRHLIYINAFMPSDSDDWRRRPFIICDGGSSAWGVVYDVASGAFHQLLINGLA